MTRDEGRAFIRARLDSQFGKTHNISDEGSSRTQLVSFVLMPVAACAFLLTHPGIRRTDCGRSSK